MSEENSSPNISLINIEMEWASKLIDVIKEGVGALSAQFVAKQMTKGKKYEIKEIAEAIAEANELPVEASYDNGDLKIKPKDETIDPVALPEYRAAEFMIRKESLKLSSVEKASLYAAEELSKKNKNGEEFSKEEVDESWIAKFFDEVGNVREDEALNYWGKLLAGEIQHPGSFSMRTLNLLANISSQDAKLINKGLNHAILASFPKIKGLKYRDNFGFIYFKLKPKTYEQEVLNHYKKEMIASLGIVAPSNSISMLLRKNQKENIFYCGKYAIKVNRPNSTGEPKDIKSGEVTLLTPLGLELLELHEQEVHEEYIHSVASKMHDKNLNVSIAKNPRIDNEQLMVGEVIDELVHKTEGDH